MPLGRDIGYLPGDKDEKLGMWMQPIFDNVAYLLSTRGGSGGESESKSTEHRMDQLVASGKIVHFGDIGQIDNPYLDAASNGLALVMVRMKGQCIAGRVTITKTERSELASLAAETV